MKKTIILVLSILLLFALFSGCDSAEKFGKFNDAEYTYDGTLKIIEVTDADKDAEIEYEFNGAIDAGIYTCKAKVTVGGKTKTLTATLKVNKAEGKITADAEQYFVYNGESKTAVGKLNHSEGVIRQVSNAEIVEVGNYTVQLVADETANYTAAASTVTIIIADDVRYGTFSSATYTYDGTLKTIEVTDADKDAEIEYEFNGAINAGTYVCKAKVTVDGKSWTLNATLKINKAEGKIKADLKQYFLYDGESKTAVGTLNHSEGVIRQVSNEETVETGTYDVQLVADETANYTAASVTVKLYIEGAPSEVIVSGGIITQNNKQLGEFLAGTEITVVPKANDAPYTGDKFLYWYELGEESTSVSFDYAYTFTVSREVYLGAMWQNYGSSNLYLANPNLVIYIENNNGVGKYDNEIGAAIEAKIAKDTKVPIKLKFEAVSNVNLGTIVAGELYAGKQVDALVNHWGADSPIDAYFKGGAASKDLSSILRNAPNFKELYYSHDPYDYAYYAGIYDNELKGLSSISLNSKWGMLVNATHMRNTSFDPLEYDIGNPNYKSLTMSQFKLLLQELKSHNRDVNYTINGAPWALDYVIAPAFGAYTYNSFRDVNGKIIPEYASAEYLEVMKFNRWMQENGYWVENPTGAPAETFYQGKNSILISWPDAENLIKQSRIMKSIGYDTIVLAPIVPDGLEMGANAKFPTAYKGLVQMGNSTQDILLAVYIDWLYTPTGTDADGAPVYGNYLMAKYGIEGVHWVDGELSDGTKTWDYHPGIKAESMSSTQLYYCGKYLILDIETLDNRVWADYTDREMNWYKNLMKFPHTPDRYPTEGVVMPNIPITNAELTRLNTALGDAYTTMRGYSWSRAAIPSGKTIESMHADIVSKLNSEWASLAYFWTDSYNSIISSRPSKV